MPQPVQGLNLDQRKFVLIKDGPSKRPCYEAGPEVGGLLGPPPGGGPYHVRIFQRRKNAMRTPAGLSTPFALAEQLLAYHDTTLRTARTVDPTRVDITANGA